MKPWHFFRRPSHFQRSLSAGTHTPRLLWFAHSLVSVLTGLTPGTVSENHAGVETAKCPESLCHGSSVTVAVGGLAHLLGGHCPSFLAPTDSCANPIPLFSPSDLPRLRSLCRLCPDPAAGGIFPTLSLRILPGMPGPLPRRYRMVHLPVSSPASSAFPKSRMGRLPAWPRQRFPAGKNFGAADISLCSGLPVR